jgi:hypothetical protein
MRFYKIIILTILAFGLIACKGEEKPASPVSTLKTYTIAVKKKDATTMKLLLSEASLKIHQDEAQAQGVTLDDIVLRDTFFPPDQRVFDYRNEKIEENKATVEVKNNIGGWDIIHLVLEDGIWKIDKKATSDQMIKEVVDPSDDFEDKLEKERKEIEKSINELGTPAPNATPGTPTDPNNPNNPTDAPVSSPNQTPASSDPTPAP